MSLMEMKKMMNLHVRYDCYLLSGLNGVRAWIGNHTHALMWGVITHPSHNLNDGQTKSPLKLWHGGIITSPSLCYSDVIMNVMASQITGVLTACSTYCTGAGQRKHQSSASLAFVRGIHRWPVVPLTKGQLRGKCFHLMTSSLTSSLKWWRHQMETFSALLAICAGNSPVSGEFPAQRLVTRSVDVFFDLRLNKLLSKHS